VKNLRRTRFDADIVEVAVENPDPAQELRFLGSPSVRVNGGDLEPGADERSAFGLMCRTYREGTGVAGAQPLALR
jgi:hypothetical protein